jgi:hypothetical protein
MPACLSVRPPGTHSSRRPPPAASAHAITRGTAGRWGGTHHHGAVPAPVGACACVGQPEPALLLTWCLADRLGHACSNPSRPLLHHTHHTDCQYLPPTPPAALLASFAMPPTPPSHMSIPGFHADAWATSPRQNEPTRRIAFAPTRLDHLRQRNATPVVAATAHHVRAARALRRDSLSGRSPRVPCNPLHYGQPLLHPSSSSFVLPLPCRRHSKPSTLQPVTLPAHRGRRACVSRLSHFNLTWCVPLSTHLGLRSARCIRATVRFYT